ncbi:MAG: hypothetical protein ACO1Q7_12135 [Gemmatimonas sp.]
MAHAARNDLNNSSSPTVDEVEQMREQLTVRLEMRGVAVHRQDSAEGLATMIESLEAFDCAVETRARHLTTDTADSLLPTVRDNPAAILPRRASHETAHTYASRIDAATARLRV